MRRNRGLRPPTPARLQRDDGFIAGNAPGGFDERRAIVDCFEVAGDHAYGICPLVVIEHVGQPDVAGVAEIDRHAESAGLVGHEVVAHHEQARLRDQPDWNRIVASLDKRRREIGVRVGHADGVGTEDAQAAIARQRHHVRLELGADMVGIGKALGDHDRRANPFVDTVPQHRQHLFAHDADDGEINRIVNLLELRPGLETASGPHVGIDHVDAPGVAVVLERRQHANRRADGGTGEPDDRHALGLEEEIEDFAIGVGHRTRLRPRSAQRSFRAGGTSAPCPRASSAARR